MQALSYARFGGPEVLELHDVAPPTITADEVLVRVKATGLNPLEWKFREGKMTLMSGKKFPQVVGTEFSGVVVDAGARVRAFAAGDEVFGFVDRKRGGSFQELVAVRPALIARKPADVSFEEAATICVVGTAAWMALVEKAEVRAGQSILINGCTGGLGIWATQMANRRGLDVTGVTGTDGLATARQLGCHHVIDYQTASVFDDGRAYDVVLDAADVLSFGQAKKLLKSGGVFLNPTPTPAQIVGAFLGNLLPGKKHHVILGAPDEERIRHLAEEASEIELLVHETFPLSQAPAAYAYAEGNSFVGKVVVTVG